MNIWDNLVQLIPHAPSFVLGLVIFFIVCWKKIKQFARDVKGLVTEFRDNIYVSKEINPAIGNSFFKCKVHEPILAAFKFFIPLQLRIDKNATDVQIILEKGKVIAIIPSRYMDNVVEAMNKHFSDNMSQFSIVRDCSKLERALELYALELVIRSSGLDGALEIATKRFINKARENEEIRVILDILVDVNTKLKHLQTSLRRDLLRILLIETCRVEFNEIGKVFM